MIDKLLIVFFCLLPWGHLFFRQVDIWHGQGQFVQVGILVLCACSFFEKPKYVQILNKPLGSFILWAGLLTSYYWIVNFSKTQHYPVKIFFPFFNLLCAIWLYKLIVEYLDREKIEKIFKYFKYSILLVLFYCVLQYLNLDQFFKWLDHPLGDIDALVGTIGNQSHLAGLLAIVQPLFFSKKREDILSLVLLWLVIFLTGSASGVIFGFGVLLFWLFFKNFKLAIDLSIVGIIALVFFIKTHGSFFNPTGRLEIWATAFGKFKTQAITGTGIGSFGLLNIQQQGTWRHLHNEYYQVAFELGIIGLVLLIWCVIDYFKKFNIIKTDLTIKLASMFFGFCLLSSLNFVGHLWQTSIIAIFAYAGIYCILNEKRSLIWGCPPEKR